MRHEKNTQGYKCCTINKVAGQSLWLLYYKAGWQPIRLTTEKNGQHHITIPNHNPLRLGTLSALLNDVAFHFHKTKELLIDELF